MDIPIRELEGMLDRARNAQLNNHLESLFDFESIDFKCEECGDTKPLIEMRFTHEHVDSGCCNDCAENQHIADSWGFSDGKY